MERFNVLHFFCNKNMNILEFDLSQFLCFHYCPRKTNVQFQFEHYFCSPETKAQVKYFCRLFKLFTFFNFSGIKINKLDSTQSCIKIEVFSNHRHLTLLFFLVIKILISYPYNTYYHRHIIYYTSMVLHIR